ncbi:hypothetical protein DERF_003969 [Dermatophagoides farinae]|uniref:Uncharacterized protein n=1 Tax=Dermatophagoides farinae TaxID=6954 RepID=A0A922LB46_DERFA|nr:hypothetical protein DERF_003969 [Dermatophagoides farinae]
MEFMRHFIRLEGQMLGDNPNGWMDIWVCPGEQYPDIRHHHQ